MQLNVNLSQKFANVILSGVKKTVSDTRKNIPKTSYGTVISKSGNQAMVQLDGSDGSTLTPCAMANDAKEGDRVAVQIKNRKAMITGNITSPANATAGDFYMELTSTSLNIGKKGGNYIAIGDDEFKFCNNQGDTLATMSLTSSNYGDAFLFLSSILGLRSRFGTDRSEVITRATSASDAASIMQVAGSAGTIASLVVDKTGVFATQARGETPARLLTAKNLMFSGTIEQEISMPAHSSATFEANANLPSGFQLIGLSTVNIQARINGNLRGWKYLRIGRFSTTPTGHIDVKFVNDDDTARTAVMTVTWFAVRCSEIGNTTSTDINIVIDDN